MDKFCITTLSSGSKYNEYLYNNLLSNEQLMNSEAEVLVTTDDESFFKDKKVKTFSFTPEFLEDVRDGRSRKWFNYHQKNLAIRNAFSQGYNKIFYIDSDIKLLKWDEERLIKKEKGFWFRALLPRAQHLEKYKFYDKLYRVDDWHYYRPVSEKIMYINECPDKIDGFLKVWNILAEQARGKINPYSEGHEILISLRCNGANVQKYRPDPFKGEDKIMEDGNRIGDI